MYCYLIVILLHGIPVVQAYSQSSYYDRAFRNTILRNRFVFFPQNDWLYHSIKSHHQSRRTYCSLSSSASQPSSSSSSFSSISKSDPAALDALERTAAHLKKLQQQQHHHRQPRFRQSPPPNTVASASIAIQTRQESLLSNSSDFSGDAAVISEWERIYRGYIQRPASSLKQELEKRSLPSMGRKPDLASRLADDDMKESARHSVGENMDNNGNSAETSSFLESLWPVQKPTTPGQSTSESSHTPVWHFAGLKLSAAAAQALGMAQCIRPSPIQEVAIPRLIRGESLILHAETGSGKTLAYLLPITERQWRWQNNGAAHNSDATHLTVIMTPTRELAAQVAGVASALAPPGSVRLIARPTNLLSDGSRERSEAKGGGRNTDGAVMPQIFIGSATALMHSLYGDGVMPASPTSKPEAMHFLRCTRTVVLDEVDRLLSVRKSHTDRNKMVHEKPAAIVCAAVARSTLGKAQVIAASATVGRPLKRELARVLGLLPQECPPVVQVTNTESGGEFDERSIDKGISNLHMGRAVTIPTTVKHFIFSIESTSPGQVLTAAYQVIDSLNTMPLRILLVLTRGFGISTQNAIGALRHFNCRPQPQSLLDALQADGTDGLIEVHRKVSRSSGVGESIRSDETSVEQSNDVNDGYLLVTGEDTVRGLHLDALDVVIIAGRAHGPDEYIHIAGRTGRAGRSGQVINIVGGSQGAAALIGWETMLHVNFHPWSKVSEPL